MLRILGNMVLQTVDVFLTHRYVVQNGMWDKFTILHENL